MSRPVKLNSIKLNGFKSIGSTEQTLTFGDITIFIGANGSGKSNLVSFFKMLGYMATGALEFYTNKYGSASSMLYYGLKKTQVIDAELHFIFDGEEYSYRFKIVHAAQDKFIFTDEELKYHVTGCPEPKIINLGFGHKESKLNEPLSQDDGIRRLFNTLLRNCTVFQFHDTTLEARIRNRCNISDDKFKYSDAGNLAAILYAMANNPETNKYYYRIVSHINAVLPQFQDFVLVPLEHNPNQIELKWRDKVPEYEFEPHQISDGSLRFMALTTLLLQPPERLPNVIIIDEPELGLHPTAISRLAGMIKSASRHVQVILATQSPHLLDEFEPEQIVVVELNDIEHKSIYKHSEFKRRSSADLAQWLDRYTLSELWEKNVLGGKP